MSYQFYEDAYQSGYGAEAADTGDMLPGIHAKNFNFCVTNNF